MKKADTNRIFVMSQVTERKLFAALPVALAAVLDAPAS